MRIVTINILNKKLIEALKKFFLLFLPALLSIESLNKNMGKNETQNFPDSFASSNINTHADIIYNIDANAIIQHIAKDDNMMKFINALRSYSIVILYHKFMDVLLFILHQFLNQK